MGNYLKCYNLSLVKRRLISASILIIVLLPCQVVYANNCLAKIQKHRTALTKLTNDFEEFFKYVEANGCKNTITLKAKATLLAGSSLKILMNSASISQECGKAVDDETKMFKQKIEVMSLRYKDVMKGCNILKALAEGDCTENVAYVKKGLNEIKSNMVKLAEHMREDGCTLTNKLRIVWTFTGFVPIFFKEASMGQECKDLLSDDNENFIVWMDNLAEETSDLQGICKGETFL